MHIIQAYSQKEDISHSASAPTSRCAVRMTFGGPTAHSPYSAHLRRECRSLGGPPWSDKVRPSTHNPEKNAWMMCLQHVSINLQERDRVLSTDNAGRASILRLHYRHRIVLFFVIHHVTFCGAEPPSSQVEDNLGLPKDVGME